MPRDRNTGALVRKKGLWYGLVDLGRNPTTGKRIRKYTGSHKVKEGAEEKLLAFLEGVEQGKRDAENESLARAYLRGREHSGVVIRKGSAPAEPMSDDDELIDNVLRVGGNVGVDGGSRLASEDPTEWLLPLTIEQRLDGQYVCSVQTEDGEVRVLRSLSAVKLLNAIEALLEGFQFSRQRDQWLRGRAPRGLPSARQVTRAQQRIDRDERDDPVLAERCRNRREIVRIKGEIKRAKYEIVRLIDERDRCNGALGSFELERLLSPYAWFRIAGVPIDLSFVYAIYIPSMDGIYIGKTSKGLKRLDKKHHILEKHYVEALGSVLEVFSRDIDAKSAAERLDLVERAWISAISQERSILCLNKSLPAASLSVLGRARELKISRARVAAFIKSLPRPTPG